MTGTGVAETDAESSYWIQDLAPDPYEAIPPPHPRDQTLVRMACLDDDAQGEPLEVLWEREVDAEVLDEAVWEKVAGRPSTRRTTRRSSQESPCCWSGWVSGPRGFRLDTRRSSIP